MNISIKLVLIEYVLCSSVGNELISRIRCDINDITEMSLIILQLIISIGIIVMDIDILLCSSDIRQSDCSY